MTKIDRPKKIPSVNILMNTPSVQKLVSMHGVALVTRCVQSVLINVRQSVLAGESTNMAALVQSVLEETERVLLPSIRPVYNLTGKQADICRIPKRGRLVPGYFADMILFDENKISTSDAYRKNDLPDKSDRLIVDPIGIKEIWVNGVNKNKNTAGKLVREFLS